MPHLHKALTLGVIMKAASIIILIFVSTIGCNDFINLNVKVYEAQKQAVLNSPYKSASGTIVYVNAQKDFRMCTLPKLIRNKIYLTNALKDTIFMTETFDETCINCPSDWVKVLLKDTVFSTRREILGHKGGSTYKVETEEFNINSKDFQFELRNSELIEIVNKVKKGERWTIDPLQYGSDKCNDGDHTIVTVIYPNKKIEAIYVRCWTPFFYRKGK